MTDNTIGFNGGTDDSTTYGFQLQPVYDLTEVPELGSNWQLKFGISYFFN
jgi:hypothetical protein